MPRCSECAYQEHCQNCQKVPFYLLAVLAVCPYERVFMLLGLAV
jgi:hypothetical protein